MPIANTQRNKARRIAKEAARQPVLTRAMKADKEFAKLTARLAPEVTEPKPPRNHLFSRTTDNNSLRQQLLDVKDKVVTRPFTVTYTPKPRTKRKHVEFETMAEMFAAMKDGK